MTYQQVTGTLNPGGHPGSYNGQDAYSDLLITEDYERNSLHRQWANEPITERPRGEFELYARPASGHNAAPGLPHDGLLWGG